MLNSVQILRGVAAFGVLLYHATRWVSPLPSIGIGAAGVDLFFVISGFIMVYASEPMFGQRGAARHFLVRRLIRIVPLYWGLTALVVLRHGFPPNLLGSYLFIPLNRGPIITVGWTLNYEMMFYGLFASLLFLQRRTAVIVLSIILVTLVTMPLIFGLALPMPWKDWSGPLLLEFVFGMLVGLTFCEGWRLRPAISWVIVFGAVALITATQYNALVDGAQIYGLARPLTWGVGAACIVAGIVLTDTRRKLSWLSNPAVKLGDASYALYLCHPLVFLTLGALGMTELIEPTMHPYAYALIFLTLVVVAALTLNSIDEAVRKRLLAIFATSFGKLRPRAITTAHGSYSQATAPTT